MKHKLIILVMLGILPIHNIASGATTDLFGNGICTSTTCTATPVDAPAILGCTSYTSPCYKNDKNTVIRFQNCTSCPTGTERRQIEISSISTYCKSTTDISVYQCCVPCGTCSDDSDFSATGTDGYERRALRSCTCGGCTVTSYKYRCAAGYYGSSSNGTSGCTRCPRYDNGLYGTSEAGSKFITNCYIPAGTSFSDTTGTGTYTAKCSYSSTEIIGGEIIAQPAFP